MGPSRLHHLLLPSLQLVAGYQLLQQPFWFYTPHFVFTPDHPLWHAEEQCTSLEQMPVVSCRMLRGCCCCCCCWLQQCGTLQPGSSSRAQIYCTNGPRCTLQIKLQTEKGGGARVKREKQADLKVQLLSDHSAPENQPSLYRFNINRHHSACCSKGCSEGF